MKHFTKKTINPILICLLFFLDHSLYSKYNPLIRKQTKEGPQIPTNPHPEKLIKEMNEQELNEMLVYAKKMDYKEMIFKIFHFLTTISSNQDSLKSYKLDFADYCYELKDFEKAAMAYEEFSILFPGSAEIEYAQYKSIICWFNLSLSPDRDQTFTHKTILLIDTFLDKATNKKYIDEVHDIRKKCRQKLFEHEAHVFEHYSKQKKLTSAQNRLNYIKKNFQDIEHINEYIKYLEKILNIAKDPKCPFFINFNLQDALAQNKKETSQDKQKTAMYFLS